MTRLETLDLGRKVTAGGLAALKPLKRLRWLTLVGGMGDEHLAQLRDFQGLEHIGPLRRVTDEGMRDLGRITSLKRLDLSANKVPVTDAGIAQLGELADLEDLRLASDKRQTAVKITDAALETVAKFHMLNYLRLSGPGITDAGLAHIKGLRRLQALWLTDTKITDAGLGYLEGMPKLVWLGLAGTAVADGGLHQIANLQSVGDLNLRSNANHRRRVGGVGEHAEPLPSEPPQDCGDPHGNGPRREDEETCGA